MCVYSKKDVFIFEKECAIIQRNVLVFVLYINRYFVDELEKRLYKKSSMKKLLNKSLY